MARVLARLVLSNRCCTRRLVVLPAAVLEMRTNDEIGNDAFHLMEEELDWLEMDGR